jgi:ERCC4-related helicase
MTGLRNYQKEILESARECNTLVVLPTGMGKTYIALFLAMERLEYGNVLFLAPTKPLVEQHRKTFSSFIDPNELVVLTGEKKPEQRKREWGSHRVVFATPQTIRNDLKKGRINMDNISLVVYDEAHRAIGEYAYVDIAKHCKSREIRSLGMTASPGSEPEKIKTICKNLNLERIESRTEDDDSLKPHIKKREVIKIDLYLPEELRRASEMFRNVLRKYNNTLIEKKFLKGMVRKRDLIALQKKILGSGRRELFYILSMVSSSIKIWHCIELLEMYGPKSCLNFVEKMKQDKTKAAARILKDEDFVKGVRILEQTKEEHPKMAVLKDIIKEERGRIIVFTQYRTTAEALKLVVGEKARLFVGQARMKQKEQIETISDFEGRKFRVLIATSIGEEGLHIPDVETAVFFEPVPSALRMIQRKGRVGRTKFGKVYLLVTKKTADESYYWTASRKERGMKKSIKTVEDGLKEERKQRSLGDFQ